MSNIIDSIQLSGVTYDLQGGGKAIEGGRGISVTTRATADTVSFNLPISAGTGTNSIIEGDYTTANGDYSHAEGMAAITYGISSHAEGFGTETRNKYEHASGRYNVSSSATTEFGDSGNTLFSVGNGTSTSDRKNALEVRQNGDIYVQSGSSTVKLQDYLGGSVTIDPTLDSGSTNPVANSAITTALDSKADKNAFSSITITSMNGHPGAKFNKENGGFDVLWLSRINGSKVFDTGSLYRQAPDFSLVETSAITTSITSGSTDSQVPSAKAVYDALGSASGGITSGEVQSMIDSSISGKADSSSLATVATSGSYNDLDNKPTIPTVPTSNTAFTNDAGYLVANDITGKTDTTAFTAHTADTTIHTTSTEKSSWNGAATNASNAITALGGLSLVKLTQSAYDALTTKDSNTLYVIVN